MYPQDRRTLLKSLIRVRTLFHEQGMTKQSLWRDVDIKIICDVINVLSKNLES